MSVTPGEGPAQPVPQPAGPGQGIVLRTGFFVLDLTLRFTLTTVTLDGHPYQLPWGEQFFPLETGRHQLQVSYRSFRRPRAGKASVLFDVAPEQVVQAVVQEDADAVGLSLLSGAHLTLVPRVVKSLADQGLDDVLVIVGGIIPEDDIPSLKAQGVAAVFTPGAPLDSIGTWLGEALDAREDTRA